MATHGIKCCHLHRIDKALELFEHDLPVYLLYNDGSETIVEDKKQITAHDGIFGIEKEDWELKRNIAAKSVTGIETMKKEEIKMEKDTNIKEAIEAMEKIEIKADEKETKKWITISYLPENSHVFNGKDLKQYVSIDAGEGYSFIRPIEQIMRDTGDENKGAFRLPIDFECTLKRSIKDENGKYVTEELKVDANSLSERIRKNDELSQFVNISVSQKRVVSTFNVPAGNGVVEYSKLLAPGGISYIIPTEKLKKDNFNKGHVYFTKHKDNVIKCQRQADDIIEKIENRSYEQDLKELGISREEFDKIISEVYDKTSEEMTALAKEIKGGENVSPAVKRAFERVLCMKFAEVKDAYYVYRTENIEMRTEELKQLYVIEKRLNAPSSFYEQQQKQQSERPTEAPIDVIDSIDKIIGKIEYLGFNGKVVEVIGYTNANMFIKKIKEENECGVPMNIIIYKDRNGNHIQTDFLSELDSPLRDIKIEEFTDDAYSDCVCVEDDELPILNGKNR